MFEYVMEIYPLHEEITSPSKNFAVGNAEFFGQFIAFSDKTPILIPE